MRLARCFLHLALLVSITAQALDEAPGVDTVDPARGYVFSGASALVLASTHISAEKLGTTWDPTSAEIARLESALTKELARRLSAPGPSSHHPHPRDYYRQYAGVYLHGRRLILINGFHRYHVDQRTTWLAQPRPESELAHFPIRARSRDFWHFVPVQVADGGEFYFEAFYDPVAKRITGFQFHGSA
jgi:hypothetical protein